MTSLSHQSTKGKQLHFFMNAARLGLALGALRTVIAACQGKSPQEVASVLARSTTSVAAGAYLGQIAADRVKEAGLDPQTSLVTGLAVGVATNYRVRGLFDSSMDESTKKG